jgi:WhiB family transcriptional regulator, redox-sensing transcriptional regulator
VIPGDWWQRAACRSAEADLFFPVSAKGRSQLDAARAKAVCERCPVCTQCLHYALATQQLHGIWGGLTEEERQLLAARPSEGSGQDQVEAASL